MGVLLGVWFFDLQAGESEKDGFETDALKYVEEVTKALSSYYRFRSSLRQLAKVPSLVLSTIQTQGFLLYY